MREIAILGTHPATMTDARDLDPSVELWAANEAHIGLVREPARIFQIHPPEWREVERRFLSGGDLPDGIEPGCFGRNQDHVDALIAAGPRACLMAPDARMPDATIYPFADVTMSVGIKLPPVGRRRLWATSTFGYMMALALTEELSARDTYAPDEQDSNHLRKIHLYGVELPIGSQRERLWEWPNLAYYLGMARGMGIEIILPFVGSSLLSAPHYAVDGHPQVRDADHWWYPSEPHVGIDDNGTGEGVYRLG